MELISLNDIEIGSRQRSLIASGPLNELKESILSVGLLNPPVCWYNVTTGKWILVAGERRLKAITDIIKADKEIRCSGVATKGVVPITPLGDFLDECGRFEAELDENVRREDLPWPDKMKAYAALHTMRLAQNPTQTIHDTAKELSEKAGFAIDKDGAARVAHKLISQAVTITQNLDNVAVANARNPTEAMQIIYRQEEDKVLAVLAKRRLALMPKSAEIEIRHDDLFKVLPLLEEGAYDLLIADPHYGIDADSPGFRARTAIHHNYADTPQSARDMVITILTEGFRVTKPRANLFIFCDIDLFPWIKITAANMGWSVFRRPLIWVKSEGEGMAPWGGQGPRITTEFIFYATKGQRGLNASPTDVLDHRRVNRTVRTHGAQKPVELFTQLIQCSTLPGDSVLDPCCGTGSSLVSCRNLKRRGLGIEINADYYASAMANVFGKTP